MVKMTVKALSNVSCEATHDESGVVLKTDAPKDVGGDASSFSPTDLVGTALLTCIMTTMGLAANRLNINLAGMHGSVEKTMSADVPRRIARLVVVLDIPVAPDDAAKAKLDKAARDCPVHHSLHPDTKMDIQINWAPMASS